MSSKIEDYAPLEIACFALAMVGTTVCVAFGR